MPRLFASLPLRIRLLGAFGAVLAVLVLLSGVAYRTTVLNLEANAQVIHTFRVISDANALLATLVDMETGYRGYLITGDDLFLEPYRDGVAQAGPRLASLRALTADNPVQVARLERIEAQFAEWLADTTEPGIALRRDIGAGRVPTEALVQRVASGVGKRRFDAIRATFQEALADEERLLTRRQAEASAAGEQLKVLLVAGSLFALALAVALGLLLTGDIVGPISRLARTAREIANGNLDERIRLRRGDEVGVAAAAFDEMTDQLQATILRTRAILNTAAEGILGLDHTGTVTFANDAAAEMLGAPAAALAGRSAASWFALAPAADGTPPDVARAAAGSERPAALPGARPAAPTGALTGPPTEPTGLATEPIGAVLRGGAVVGGAAELLPIGAAGPRPVEFACAPIKRDRDVIGAVLTFRDITERLAAQRALEERARELARSNADLEQFAYVASHDLQEPLRAVVSYLQLLERRYADQLDDRARRYIGHAVDGGRRMQTLITDLLTYSRVGRRGTEFAAVDLETVFERVVAGLNVAIEESGAVVTHDPLPTVVGDSTQLAQLLQNLIANAVKFRAEARPEIHVGAERADGGWLFSVRDNGIGIAPEYRDRVFVLFQRLHARDEYSGTGIGLAVCKKIVERHGGTLWVDSTPGGGSTFRFTLPDAGDQT